MYLFSSAAPQRTAYSGSPSKDWQSTVGWGNCRIQPGTAGLHSDVTTNEPPLLPRSSDADDFIILRKKIFFLASFLARKLKEAFFWQESLTNKKFCLRMMKNCQHQHKGKSHTQEKISGCCNFYGRCNSRYSTHQWS